MSVANIASGSAGAFAFAAALCAYKLRRLTRLQRGSVIRNLHPKTCNSIRLV
jgi:hypothetical protein